MSHSSENSHRPSAVRSWLQLFRAPNLFTAPGDPLAGYLLANQVYGVDATLPLAIGASLLFYGGGLVLNDIADIEEDRRDRPNRPLPSGAVARGRALKVVVALFAVALALCWAAGEDQRTRALMMGAALLVSIVSYNLWTKHIPVLGALNMGACRSFSMLVGACAGPRPTVALVMMPAILVGLYIAAVTNLARHETRPRVPVLARLLPAVVAAFIAFGMWHMTSMAPSMAPASIFFVVAAVFVIFLAVRLFVKPSPLPPIIGSHIRVLLLLQAGICWAGQSYDNGRYAAAVLVAFIPLSYFTARRFYAS